MTVLVRILTLAMGGLCVLCGGLFLLTGSGEQLRYLVVMLGGAALCLAAVWPTFRPGRWTTAGFVLAGMAAAPATYWIRRWDVCCEFVWVGSYGYPWRWGAPA
ncbi:MAG: hypothetical protein QOJ50_316, partial [Cryptosporangiaceae bacterium]|nr:hypothetical protein [Cryptosporangiaceae bacterium]